MKRHARSYAENTTAHGFSRVVQGSNIPGGNWGPRLAWALAILVSFSMAGYLIGSSISEAQRNPIATDIEYISVKTIWFPSVTLEAAISDGMTTEYPLRNVVMEQLDYDCRQYKEVGGEAKLCMEKSAAAKSIVHPLTEYLVETMFQHFLQIVMADDAKPAERYIRFLTCAVSYPAGPTRAWTRILNPLLESLSGPSDLERAENLQLCLNSTVKHFGDPSELLTASLSDSLKSYLNPNMTRPLCSKRYFDELKHEAKAMLLLLVKIQDSETSLSFSKWYSMIGSIDLDESATQAFKDNLEELQTEVSSGMKGIVKVENMTLMDIMTFLDQVDFSLGYGSLGIEQMDDGFSQKYYKEILQVGKFTMQPLWSNMTEQARVRDVQEVLNTVNATYGRSTSDSFRNPSPALLHCKYGNHEDSKLCQTPVTTFTKSGLGYTLNTDHFFKLYQKSHSRDVFCQEVNERTGQKMCLEGNNTDSRVAFIEGSGPDSSLTLLLSTPQQEGQDHHPQRIAIHHPGSVVVDYIEPNPGMHTTLVLTPHITKTDDSLLEQDKSARGCHHQEVDANPLKIFTNYTRDNCEFECHLKRSIEKCNCVPWTFPKLDEDVRTCSQQEAATCFDEAMRIAQKEANCSHCMDECNKVDYDITVHTRPLKKVCKEDKAVRDAINREVPILSNFLPHSNRLQEMGLKDHLHDSCSSHAIDNVAVVEIRFGSSRAVQTTHRVRVTTVDQVADIGGILGLCTGMSVLSWFEVFAWVFEIPWVIWREMQIRMSWAAWEERHMA